MIEQGDVYLADLHEERRRRVLVVTIGRFHQQAGRVFVAPEAFGIAAEAPYPWRMAVAGGVFAVDRLRSIDERRLLERVDRASAVEMASVRQVLRTIT